ncbi:P pilus assembly protein, porin PapC [Herbaspirillum sp. CF444]|uniref:fimbria/pilus outer membrane usher protein n=1 Tax=Herbaspirillum sp. CF444 TaxID=1144319 RepID=UPI0002722D98|nr:fimbria/pilus outer membrane usher protein [Herbaspirillum sp. CF444]EJL88729.1 P pilus assembly protein, porin PapC [Herbaspirillum sp. CF444]
MLFNKAVFASTGWLAWMVATMAVSLPTSAHATTQSGSSTQEKKVSEYRFLEGLEMASPINKGTLSRFNRVGNIEPGTYRVDMFVNGVFRERRSIRFDVFEGLGVAACLSRQDLAVIDLRRDLVSSANDKECSRIDTVASGATATLDFSALKLVVSVPQSLLNVEARGYIDPQQYDAGNSIGFVNYNASQYYARLGNSSSSSTFVSTSSGLNLGLWRLRQQGSMRYDAQHGFAWNPIRTYAKRAIARWGSELTLGENFTSGNFFSGMGYQGIELSSDPRMLPDSLRGYAPVIRGTARSNAQVIVAQKGREIYRTTVAAGSFVIDDLNPTSYNGDLDVTVIEADGSRVQFSVPFSSVPESMRPGMSHYSLTLGRTRDSDAKDMFADVIYQLGVSNSLTVNTGLRLARGYQSVALGGVWAGKIGALGMNLNYSRAEIGAGWRSSGWMSGLSYSHSFAQTGTTFSIASYRYSTAGYRELSDVQNERQNNARDAVISTTYKQRSRLDVSLSQQLGSRGAIYLSGLTQNFYDSRSRLTQLQLGYSTVFNNAISLNIAFQRQQTTSDTSMWTQTVAPTRGSSLMVSMSIPLGVPAGNRPTVSTSFTRSGKENMLQTQLSGMSDGERHVNYGVGVNHASGGGQDSINANAGARFANAAVSVNASHGPGYWQTSANARGAIAVHTGGITFGPYLGDTFALIEAKGAEGAKVYNGQGAVIDGNGYALVPSLSPYRRNMVGLMPEGISSKVELTDGQRSVVPYAGASLKLSFKTRQGNAMLIKLIRPDGNPVPMGADVLDEAGSIVGMVGQGSQAYLRSDKSKGRLAVRWGDHSSESCAVTYDLTGRDTAKPLIRLEGQCSPGQHLIEFMPASIERQTAAREN